MSDLICGGCQRVLQPGDRYIEDTPSGYLGEDADPDIDALIADLMTGRDTLDGTRTTLVFCEDCTHEGGRYDLRTLGSEGER